MHDDRSIDVLPEIAIITDHSSDLLFISLISGVSKDGLVRHFFHRPSRAYTTGTRKRRKVHSGDGDDGGGGGETRWHKTGKTRPVLSNGRPRGYKKILVLYTNYGKQRKPEKTNWVMHQYHLGDKEEEREGELVVSKIFYQTQPRQCGGVAEPAAAAASSDTVEEAAADPPVLEGMVAPPPDVAVVAGAFHGAAGIDEFNFAQFRSSFEEVSFSNKHHCVLKGLALAHYSVELFSLR